MKRKRPEIEIPGTPEIPVEIFYRFLSWVPILDVIVSRRVSVWWRVMIDSWKERFQSLSIMYDGPACAYPLDCPFRTEYRIINKALDCLMSPPFALHAQTILIGNAAFHNQWFGELCTSEKMKNPRITAVGLRATLITASDGQNLGVYTTVFERVISEIDIDMTRMNHYYDHKRAVETINDLALARTDNKLTASICMKWFTNKEIIESSGEAEDDISQMQNIKELSGTLILEGFGWFIGQHFPRCLDVWNDILKSETPMKLIQINIDSSTCMQFVECVAASQHLHTLETLYLNMNYMNGDIEIELCNIIDSCPNLKNAILDVQPGAIRNIVDMIQGQGYPAKFPWEIVKRLSKQVTNLRLRLVNMYPEYMGEVPSFDFNSFRRVEIVVNGPHEGCISGLLQNMPNVEYVRLNYKGWMTNDSHIEELCRKCTAKYILFDEVETIGVSGFAMIKNQVGSVLFRRI